MVTAFCTVTKGDFPLNISWTLNGNSLSKIFGINVLRTNQRISQLSIESVQEEHAGEYSCIASNNAGSVIHSTKLKVNGI